MNTAHPPASLSAALVAAGLVLTEGTHGRTYFERGVIRVFVSAEDGVDVIAFVSVKTRVLDWEAHFSNLTPVAVILATVKAAVKS